MEEHLGEIIYKLWKPHDEYNEDELTELWDDIKAEVLITEHDHVTKKVIEAFPHLKFIGVCRGAPSNVSISTATKVDIPVFLGRVDLDTFKIVNYEFVGLLTQIKKIDGNEGIVSSFQICSNISWAYFYILKT